MKKYYFVIINWRKENPSSVLEVASKVSENMKGNDNFPNPDVPMTDFDKKLERAEKAFVYRDNGKLAKIELDNATADMDETLRTQAQYVTEQAKGSKMVIETSGYKPSKDSKAPSIVPDRPTNIKLKSKNGIVTLITKRPNGATSLCWVLYFGDVPELVTVKNKMLVVPAGVAAQILSPAKAREEITGLAVGTKVTAQVLAQSSAGCSALSEPVTIYVNK